MKKKKNLIIFGTGKIAQLANYYFTNDSRQIWKIELKPERKLKINNARCDWITVGEIPAHINSPYTFCLPPNPLENFTSPEFFNKSNSEL